MQKNTVAGAVLAFALVFGAGAKCAEAFPAGAAAQIAHSAWEGGPQKIHYACRCGREWPAREYWRWDHRPIWDDPWQVLRPTIWGSPEPHVVPADIWARKWHLPARSWRWHHRR
jgi:hypothetical protein